MLQNTFFYFDQAIVVLIQNANRPINGKPIVIVFTPGQIQHRIQVVADHSAFRHHRRHLKETIDLLIQTGRRFLGQRQRFDFSAMFLGFCVKIFFVP